ncbi:MAG: hypothetical protein K8S23_02780 [Candidatus Cloacimonetes bacterium]|nr:hypothetical protein [Candidatus Cloacimonadota bacterium]
MKLKLVLTLFFIGIFTFIIADNVSIYDIQYTEEAGVDETYPSPLAGDTVTTTGIVVATYYTQYEKSVFIMDPTGGEWNGIYLFNIDSEPSIGDEIEVAGEVSESQGFTQIWDLPVMTVTVLSSGNTLPEPINISTSDLASEEKYESVFVKINNVSVTQIDGYPNNWYVSDDSGECRIGNKFYTFSDPQIDDEFISIAGLVNYSGGEYALNPRDIGDFDTGPPTIISAISTSITEVEIVFSKSITSETAENISNYSINDLSVNEAVLQYNQRSVLITTSEHTSFEIYTITVNNIEDLDGDQIEPNSTVDFIGYDDYEFLRISEIRDNLDIYEGQTVTVKGIVTIGAGVLHTGRVQVYIQDISNRGIQLYNSSLSGTHLSDLVRGNELIVTGKVELYSGVLELTEFDYEIVTTDNEPEPVIMSISEALTNNHEGTYLQVTGEIVDDPYNAGGGWNIEIFDDNSPPNGITIRAWDTTGIEADILDVTQVGIFLKAKGVGGIFNQAAQVLVGYEDQLSEGDIYDYLLDVNISPTFPKANEPATITYTDQPDSLEVSFYWKTNEDIRFRSIKMTKVEDREDDINYECTLPGQKQGIEVQFYIKAIDKEGEVSFYPSNAPNSLFPIYFRYSSFKAKLNVPPKPFNPYAGMTFPIEFAIEGGNKAILRIYNAEGKLVATPYNNFVKISTGFQTINWDGRDKDHRRLPLGLYIVYLEVIESGTGNKKTAKAPIIIGAPLK